MNIFSDYIQPLTAWIHAHPHWALLITFLISLSESLAIIGSIIPGSVTMTALGILAGSGIMRIDLTLLAATLGAIAGDSTSYALGFTFRNRLVTIWPFSKYPNWVNYGKDYFVRHGGKSVLIGRFIGPLRSIIPVIAGMMNMNRWHFLAANVSSAILWALVYVMPGVLIGTASSELSPESASRLFIVILLLLAAAWLLSWALKWLLKHLSVFLKINLHRFWLWSKDHPKMAYLFRFFTPRHEVNHYPTAALLLAFIFTVTVFTAITLLSIQSTWVMNINSPIYLFLQSLRAPSIDTFFIVVNLFIHPLTLGIFLGFILLYCLYVRAWRIFAYVISLLIWCAVFVFLLNYSIDTPNPVRFLNNQVIDVPFPSICLTFATSLFSFLIFLTTANKNSLLYLIRFIFILILLLAGIGTLYLGDAWLTGVLEAYAVGVLLFLIHWIFYRRSDNYPIWTPYILTFSLFCLLFSAVISYKFYFKKLVSAHYLHLKQYVLTDKTWWDQKVPLLPLYVTNRIGQKTGLLNIQYAGSLNTLQKALENYGWKTQTSSYFYTLLKRAGGESKANEVPLITQLYLNQKPNLVMTYKPSSTQPFLILRLWRSNYHLQRYPQPIWVGSVHIYIKNNKNQNYKWKSFLQPFEHILPALNGFKFNSLVLQNELTSMLPQSGSQMVLFIKEPN